MAAFSSGNTDVPRLLAFFLLSIRSNSCLCWFCVSSSVSYSSIFFADYFRAWLKPFIEQRRKSAHIRIKKRSLHPGSVIVVVSRDGGPSLQRKLYLTSLSGSAMDAFPCRRRKDGQPPRANERSMNVSAVANIAFN